MSILVVIGKVLLFPFVVVLTIIQWVGIFLISVSSVAFNLLAGLFFLVGVASYILGLTSGPEALMTILIGFVLFMFPIMGEWIITMITIANAKLRGFIRS